MHRLWILFMIAVKIYGLNGPPGPIYPPTQGEIWPAPQREMKTDKYYSFYPGKFKFVVKGYNCSIIDNALKRYVYSQNTLHDIVKRLNPRNVKKRCSTSSNNDLQYQGHIKSLEVDLNTPCEEYPSLDMVESYTLVVSDVSKLESNSVWGILRGLESFSQLFYITKDFKEVRINETGIIDYPTYSHRGLLLDTSRHYISVRKILLTLDAMAMNKLNVFHWHIVDDPSFPYQSEKFPELSEKGAFHPLLVYTKTDIQHIIETARNRGIRVIPEFDVPGHTLSWGEAYPSILTKCYNGDTVTGLGPMNPINNATYKLLGDLFKEIKELFPDKYMHLGGDEVELSCWASNPTLKQYMEDHGMKSAAELHKIFEERVNPIVEGLNASAIVWQEVYNEGVPLPDSTIIHLWKDYDPTKYVSAGRKVIYSTAWYLDHLKNGGDWRNFFTYDPQLYVDTIYRDNILGGEACMWGEVVDDNNVISRVWPRASATAERLWTGPKTINSEQAANRLEEHTCRMLRRGVAAQPPNNAGFCVHFTNN